MKVKDVMNKFPLAGEPNDTLRQAVQRLAWIGGRHLPVVANERLVGIVSAHDLAAALAAHPPVTKLGDIMTTPVQTCGPDDSLTEVTGRMAAAKIGCLPVTDKGHMVGLITITDVLFAQVLEATRPVTNTEQLTASDVMTANPFTVKPDDHLLDAAARMRQLRVRHLPVIDGSGVLVGMLTDRDIRQTIGDPLVALGPDAPISLETMRVQDVMSRDPITVGRSASIVELARIMSDLTVSAVPVVDEKRRPTGIVSYVDLLRAYAARSG